MGVESMRCRNCGASLEAGRVDTALGVVTCAHCGGLHELPEPPGRVEAPADGAAEAARRKAEARAAERGVVALPERFDVHRGAGALQVRWAKGNRAGAVILAGFALVWGFAATSTGLLFLVPVSLILLYLALVRGVNRTTFRVDGRGLSVRQGPLPARGAKRDMARSDVAQLFASEHVTRSSMDSDRGPHRRVQEHRSYRLQAIDREGRKKLLIGGLSSADQALWLEREAEALLGLENVAVAGEVR